MVQVPFTYRDAPLEGAEHALVGTTEHSALGTRWVYDGLGDPNYLVMLAAVAMTGQGEALGLAVYDGRWHIAPTNVRLEGGGWSLDRVAVDGFEPARETSDDGRTVLHNDGFELTFFRRPIVQPRPDMGLTARWPGQEPVLLAAVQAR